MARKPATKKTATADAGREGLRERKKIEYNEHKLAVAAARVPVAPKKKAAAPVKKTTGTKKKGKKGTTYLVLIKRVLKDVEAPGWGVESILKHLSETNPDKTNRRYIRQALFSGVEKKLFVKTKGSFRLTKNTQDKLDAAAKKEKAAKKAAKKAATTKKTTKKGTTTKKTKTAKKKTTKKEGKDEKKKATTTKKKAAKEAKPKKEGKKKKAEPEASSSPAPKKAKKVIGPPAGDDSTAVTEAAGVWQYYDGGWHNYANDASLIVEGVFKEFEAAGEGSGLDIRAIQSGHFSYMVNFKDMEQTNTQTGTKRKIRRV